MIGHAEQPAAGGSLDPAASGGTALGKRYINGAANLELLCTKPGKGALSVGNQPLVLKEAKPLPSSD